MAHGPCWVFTAHWGSGGSQGRASLQGLVGATNAALGSCALGKRWRNAVDVLSHLGRAAPHRFAAGRLESLGGEG